MSGEFGEILVYDYINFVLKHYITRTRYLEKVNPDMSVSGSDVIGYQVKNIDKPSKTDRLIVAEVKTRSRIEEAKIVERFQNKTDNPFRLDFFAVAVLDNELYSDQVVLYVVNSQPENVKSTNVLVILSKELKLFLRDSYRRACSC